MRQAASVDRTMALRVVATAIGGPEVLALVDESEPEPGPGEALLEVRAAGVNPVDVKRYGGSYGPAPEFPMRLGFEAAGVVRAVGPDALGPGGPVSVGDEVIAGPDGRCVDCAVRGVLEPLFREAGLAVVEGQR